MAEKKTELSIVLRTVDKATAKLREIGEKLDKLTKPIRNFGEAFDKVREKSGLDDVIDGFGGVGDALGGLLMKAGMVVGVLAAATAGVLSLVGSFDDLGDKAEALGVGVDWLAQMRYAAERSGVEVQNLDGALRTMAVGVGAAKAGTGKLAGFLKLVSPELLKQVKAAKSNEEAFDLLANAMSKIEDPAKKVAFAQKVFGDASMATLASKGAAGVKELRDRYLDLAGSQEGAAGAAGQTDDALKDLHAATDGVKAAIVEGLAPALTEIIKKISEWLKGHRGDVKEWAAEIGKKLPAAFDKLVDAVKGAIDFLTPFFDSTTKIKIAIGLLVAVIVGPLIASIISLGVTIMATPVGWILAAFAALAVAIYEIYKHWDGIADWFKGQWQEIKDIFWGFLSWVGDVFLNYTPLGLIIKHWSSVKEFFVGLWDGVTSVFSGAWDFIKSIVDKVTDAVDFVVNGAHKIADAVGLGDGVVSDAFMNAKGASASAIAADMQARQQAAQAQVTVKFDNAPKGTRVDTAPSSTANVDLSVGYQMGAL
jgi:hypothetical protein